VWEHDPGAVLAKEHGVILIPKRFLARVLGMPGATTDGLHLSNTGHVLLAETVAGLFAVE
jgi:lysophospholipase L1-like esterase